MFINTIICPKSILLVVIKLSGHKVCLRQIYEKFMALQQDLSGFLKEINDYSRDFLLLGSNL